MVCLSSRQFKWRDGCETRCSSYCLRHVKFNSWSVCQAASSNGEMNVNQDFHLLVCSTSNSIYRLSVKPPVQMARWMSIKMFILLFAPRQIRFIICLSSCQFKWGDECQSRCSSYCLCHVKFNLWSVCQAASSNGEMNVNQDVRLIVCARSNSFYGLSVKLPVQMGR